MTQTKKTVKTKRPFKRRTHRRAKRSNKELIIYKAPAQMPYAPRFRTKFSCDVYGYWNASSIIMGGIQMYVKLNGLLTPYNGGNWSNALPGITTLMPTGLTALLNSQLYQSFRVYGSRIEFEMLPNAAVDSVECTITPSESVGAPATVATAMSQPLTKSGFFSFSKNDVNSRKGSTLINSCTQHRLLGVSKSAIENDLSGNYEGSNLANPIVPMFWIVNVATANGILNTLSIDYRCKMTYFVELWANNSGNLVQT